MHKSQRESEVVAGIQRGLADVAAGRVVPHDKVMAEARRIIGDARQARH